MTLTPHNRMLFVLACLFLIAADDADAPFTLGAIPEYATETQAQAQCKPDVAIWADKYSGYYYPRWHPRYGHTAHGVFTCLKPAIAGDYWNFNPFGAGHEDGREFPIDPDLLSPGVS